MREIRGSFFFTADIPPSVNHLYATSIYEGRPRRFMTSQGKRYKEALGWLAKEAAGKVGWRYEGGELAFIMYVIYPDNRRRDITNGIKIVEDAVAEALGFDDKMVAYWRIEKSGIDKEDPHIYVMVQELEPEAETQ